MGGPVDDEVYRRRPIFDWRAAPRRALWGESFLRAARTLSPARSMLQPARGIHEMRSFLPAIAVILALSFATSSGFAYGLCDLLGSPKQPCGCGCDVSCGCPSESGCACEADCGCEPTCEASCGCEPGCGCGSGCCVDGRQFAGQKYQCGCNSRVPWCPCTGPECCDSCGCGAACGEPCGYDPGCGCEPACGCASDCGGCCEPCCAPKSHTCCLKHVGFCHVCWEVVDVLSGCCSSGCGCDEEVYWSEWHNDPPRCCDPCDCYGNWVGPSAGGYRAPYAHAYSPDYVATGGSPVGYAKSKPARQQNIARQSQPARAKTQVANNRGAAAIVIRR